MTIDKLTFGYRSCEPVLDGNHLIYFPGTEHFREVLGNIRIERPEEEYLQAIHCPGCPKLLGSCHGLGRPRMWPPCRYRTVPELLGQQVNHFVEVDELVNGSQIKLEMRSFPICG